MKPVTIVGGGLAGLGLGIGLRRCGVPATIIEAGRYPRHRVCGEFLCGRGRAVLERLGMRDRLMRAGLLEAHTAAFFSKHRQIAAFEVASPALLISRYVLDAAMADEFSESGGELRQGVRWPSCNVEEGIVCASGRRRVKSDEAKCFGLKAHARRVELTHDLEMHQVEGGYVGISNLPDGKVNVCGLFLAGSSTPMGSSSDKKLVRLRGSAGTVLHERLAQAEFEPESICAVAGFDLVAQNPAREQGGGCVLGDAFSMIAPVTGNGMSIALESAELAVPVVAEYSRGNLGWAETVKEVHRLCEQAFAGRIRWGRIAHRMILSPVTSMLAVPPFGKWCLDWFFHRTR